MCEALITALALVKLCYRQISAIEIRLLGLLLLLEKCLNAVFITELEGTLLQTLAVPAVNDE